MIQLDFHSSPSSPRSTESGFESSASDRFGHDTTVPQGAGVAPDSAMEFAQLERSLRRRDSRSLRWIGWRLRALVAAALLGCVAIAVLARWLGEQPHVDATWRATPQGTVELVSSRDPLLQPHAGRALVSISDAAGGTLDADPLLLQRSSRWLVDDAQRARHRTWHERLAAMAASGPLELHFSDGSVVGVPASGGGFAALGLLFWMLAALALVLYVVGMVVALARPSLRNLLYALIALCQTGNLLFMAVQSAGELLLPQNFALWDVRARVVFDLVTAAAVAHISSRYPHRVPGAGWIGIAAWGLAGVLGTSGLAGAAPHLWWQTQAGATALGLAAIALLSWSYRLEPHPFAVVLRRFSIVNVATWILLTVAMAAAAPRAGTYQSIAAVGPMIWYVFFASLLLLVPFLSKSQQIIREFSLLAAISTAATALDLLFAAVFSLGEFTSLTLSLFFALGAYAGARQWILSHLIGGNMLTMERLFERLYRMARELEAQPQRAPTLLLRLLRELFEPLETVVVQRAASSSRVGSDGSTLLVPVPQLGEARGSARSAIVIRYAHRGRRLFTTDDARLTDRIVEQLRRAVAFDKAVEQGRSEERARIAQDLHDDIGARLLTLMYKAPTPEMEDYVRHTLQDLKTLTRGLAAHGHRLSHAAAEWKADLTQRLQAAQCELAWNVDCDREVDLSVVQWSALTRVLRELVNNVLTHAQATRVDITLQVQQDRLDVSVRDNGVGRNPKAWAHGLGLGGVRKRVKQLGGVVEWREADGGGIECRVRIRGVSLPR